MVRMAETDNTDSNSCATTHQYFILTTWTIWFIIRIQHIKALITTKFGLDLMPWGSSGRWGSKEVGKEIGKYIY